MQEKYLTPDVGILIIESESNLAASQNSASGEDGFWTDGSGGFEII